MKKLFIPGWFVFMMAAALFSQTAGAAPPQAVQDDARCAVCGMFVAKYPNWVSQIRYADGSEKYFDGMKDLMAHYFDPAAFGTDAQLATSEIWVKDYYSLQWIDGRQAFYVTGSDVFGPMGDELIPFAEKSGAENFLKDHHGKKVLAFDEITREMVDAMRAGHKMKGHMQGGGHMMR